MIDVADSLPGIIAIGIIVDQHVIVEEDDAPLEESIAIHIGGVPPPDIAANRVGRTIRIIVPRPNIVNRDTDEPQLVGTRIEPALDRPGRSIRVDEAMRVLIEISSHLNPPEGVFPDAIAVWIPLAHLRVQGVLALEEAIGVEIAAIAPLEGTLQSLGVAIVVIVNSVHCQRPIDAVFDQSPIPMG